MTLTVSIESESLSSDARSVFAQDAEWAFQAYTALCTKFDLPMANVHMVLTDDLEGAVRLRTGSTSYKAERGPVRVTAKCLYGRCGTELQNLNVIVDSWPWEQPQDPSDRLRALTVVNHELMHPVLDELWVDAGIPKDTGESQDLGRTLSDEYWADMLALACLEALKVSVTISTADGASSQIPLALLLVAGHMDALELFLRDSHPHWPDTVQAYREWSIDLDTMRQRLASSFGECAILLAHTQAYLDAAHENPSNRSSVFSTENLACLPAAQLYVAEPWQALWECIQSAPLSQGREKLREYHDQLSATADSFFRQIWRSLGVEITPLPEGGAYFHVGEPKR
ncbi:MAG TPA: hypothetical protein VD969_17370 [Symbiobacteriaceae bacterium]|nr:hypothetical protein [Symbiobacteriaceae bacterium]